MTYPAEIRAALQSCRARGMPFDKAWEHAVSRNRPPSGWGGDDEGYSLVGGESPLRFMRRVFQPAYEGLPAVRPRVTYCRADTGRGDGLCWSDAVSGGERCRAHQTAAVRLVPAAEFGEWLAEEVA